MTGDRGVRAAILGAYALALSAMVWTGDAYRRAEGGAGWWMAATGALFWVLFAHEVFCALRRSRAGGAAGAEAPARSAWLSGCLYALAAMPACLYLLSLWRAA